MPITATTHNQSLRPRRRTPLLQRRPVVAILAVCICLFLGYGSTYAAHPFLLAYRMRTANDEQERAIRRLQIENQESAKKIRAFSDPAGRILILRQHDFILRDEFKLAIPETHN